MLISKLISKHNRLALLLFYSSSCENLVLPSNCVVHKIFNVNSCIIHFSMRLCLLSSYCKFLRNDNTVTFFDSVSLLEYKISISFVTPGNETRMYFAEVFSQIS